MSARILALLGALVLAGPALAQQPTQAQIGAIRSSCRSDFQANCSGVQPGGQAALACLQEHSAALSPSCQKAVAAVGGGGAAAPAAPPPSAAAPHAAPAPNERGLVREACAPDYRALCRGVRPGGGRVIACFSDHQASLSPGCAEALGAVRGR